MTSGRRFHFERFCLDTATELVTDGETALALTPKAFSVLCRLIEQPGNLVTKEQLLAAVWPDVVVGDAVLKVAVAQIRDALGDDAENPRFIATVHRRGYRFIAPVTTAVRRRGSARENRPSAPRRDGVLAAGFVGRDEALGTLDAALEIAAGGARQVVFVSGEAGIGKTTLVDAFLASTSDDPAVWIARGECLEQYGVGEPYLPLLAALSRLCRGPHGAAALPLLTRLAPSWLDQMPWLRGDTPAAPAPEIAQRRLLLEMAEALEALTADHTLVLVLEDLHWSDYSTLDLLSLLARRDEPARLVIVATYRPVDVVLSGHPLKAVKRDLVARGRCQEVALDLLSQIEVDAYLAARLSGAPTAEELRRFVYARTDGNPLFMVALVDTLVAQGLLHRDTTTWRLAAGLDATTVGVPETLREAIEKEIERLEPAAQAFLEAASIAGAEFTIPAVAAALGEDVDRAETQAEALARSSGLVRAIGTVVPPGGRHASRYAFAHSLYQNVLYDRVAPARRMRLHQRVGEHEERAYGADTREVAAELAVHFEASGDAGRAIRHREAAAAKATDRFAYREAIDHLQRALALVAGEPDGEPRDRVELRLQMALAPALLHADGFGAPAAHRSYDRARLLSERLGTTPELFPALRGLAVFSLARGELATARVLAERCVELASHAGDPALVSRAHLALGSARYYLGEHAAACEDLEHALTAGRVAGESAEPSVLCLGFLSQALWFVGRPDDALARSEAARANAQAAGHVPSMFWADHTAALLHQFRGERDAAETRAATAIRLAHEHDLTQWTAWALVFQGWLAAQKGALDEGIATMRRGVDQYRATGAELGRVFFLTLLADACRRAGRADDAITVVDEALASASARGERYYEPEALRVKGDVLLARDPDAGEMLVRRALELARSQGAGALELRAATTLARTLATRGQQTDAHAVLAPPCAAVVQGAATLDVVEARSLLAALAPPSRRSRRTRG